MIRCRALLIGALAMFVADAARPAWIPRPDQAFAPRSWPGRVPAADDRGFDVREYRLELDLVALPPDTPRLDGTTHILLDLLDPPPARLRLDLVNDLSVSAVLRDGEPVAWTHAGDSLVVALPDLPQAGAEHLVSVSYGGTPPRHGPFYAGLLSRVHGDGQPSVGNVSEPFSSHSWFACKDHPADKAALRMTVTAPETLTVVATGRLLSREPLPDARAIWRWSTDHPVAPYLVGLAVSDFVSWQEDCGDVPLHFHVFPEHLETAEDVLAPTCEMMRWLQDLLGPYPFPGEKYAQAEFVWGGAMENQTATVMGQSVLLQQPVRDARLVVVHEMAHHWFGDSLTPRRWKDIWLNEGFARYTEALWVERTEGPDAYRAYLDLHTPDDLFQGDGLLGDPDPILQPLVYDKGAWLLHMLRGQVSDPTFFAILSAYATDPDLVHATTDRDRFAEIAGRVGGLDAAAFLAPWLDTEVVPELSVRWSDRGDGRTQVDVVQTQDGPLFPLAVTVRVHAGAEVRDLRLRMDGVLAGAEIRTTATVDSVVVDPDRWLLRRTATTPPPQLLAALPRPNPALEDVDLAYWLAGADRIRAAVYDLRGRVVRRVDLGAQPATGPREEGAEPRIWTWDGRDQDGRRAAAGIYWLVLQGRDDRTVRKVTLLR